MFEHEFSNLNVVLGALIECGIYDFALDGSLHVRNFLRTLVDQENDELAGRIIGCNGISDLLEQDSLTCFRRRNYHTSLSLSDRAEQVDDPGGDIFLLRLES